MTRAARRGSRKLSVLGALLVVMPALALAGAMTLKAGAATPTTINLGTTAAASVLAGAGVTNTGPSILNRDLDTWPNPAITGFPPGKVLGTQHAADGVAQQAQSDLTTAYNAAASAPSTNDITGVDLSGKTLTQGVYTATSGIAVNGPLALTLNGGPDSVFPKQEAHSSPAPTAPYSSPGEPKPATCSGRSARRAPSEPTPPLSETSWPKRRSRSTPEPPLTAGPSHEPGP